MAAACLAERNMRRLLVLGLLALTGCKTLPAKPYPADPLFISREPTPGKAPVRPVLLAAATPMPRPPSFPVALLTTAPPAHFIDDSEASAAPPQVAGAAPTAQPPPVMQHAADYRWLIGVLDRHYQGHYFLRYCPATAPDRWGGKVRLQDPRLADYHDGDVVRLDGILAPLMAPPAPGECQRYHIQRIQLLRR